MTTSKSTHKSKSDGPAVRDEATGPAERNLPVTALVPRAENRKVSDDTDLAELAESLLVVGQLNPIHVQQLPDASYEILAGVRRRLASKRIGAAEIRAIVHERCDDATADQIRFIENQHRREPTALDTAQALRRIKNLGGLTHAEVAKRTAISLSRVKQYLGLFTASDALLDVMEAHSLPISVAVELVRYEKARGERASRAILKRVVAGEITVRELARMRKKPCSPRGKTDAAEATRGDPWAAVEARIERLVAKAPDQSISKLRALAARLGAMLEAEVAQ